jgi:hypothetical protein
MRSDFWFRFVLVLNIEVLMCDRTGNDDFSALRLRLFSWKQLALILVGVLAFPAFTKADFNGFGDFSNFNLNQTDGGSAPLIAANSIQLTSNSDGQARSIFHVTRMGVETFDASFIYRMEPGSMFGAGIGAAFVLQNSAAGSDAIGPGNLAYQGISNSIAISLETSTSSQGNASFTGFYQNGVVDGGSTPAAPVSFLPGKSDFCPAKLQRVSAAFDINGYGDLRNAYINVSDRHSHGDWQRFGLCGNHRAYG